MSKDLFDKFPHVWVPRVGVIEAELSPPSLSMEGEYTIRKYKADGRLVQEVGPFKNLITNIGLNQMGAATGSSKINQYCFVGTGTGTPSVSDTVMAAYHAYTNGLDQGWAGAAVRGGAPDYWVQGSGTSRFGLGVAAGNLTEVGMGWTTGGTMATDHRVFSRALIVDGLGNPITITVLSDEYLDVTYSLRFYPPLTDATQSVNLSGTSYTFTTRAADVNNNFINLTNATLIDWRTDQRPVYYTGTNAGTPPSLAAVTASTLADVGASSSNGTASSVAYAPNTLKREVNYSLGLNQGNLSFGIRGIMTELESTVSTIQQRFQTTISPAIPKDSSKVMSFGQSITWGRH